jgi:4-hydroxymandelate synthase
VQIQAIDHIELYVADAEAAAAQLCETLGFAVTGRGDAATGLIGCRSVLLRQQGIALLLTSATEDRHPAADYVRRHGDGVAVVGLRVEDARAAFHEALIRGAWTLAAPIETARAETTRAETGSGAGRVTGAAVAGFGDVAHRFVSRDRPGSYLPGIVEPAGLENPPPGGLLTVDHLAVCLPAGELTATVRHYRDVFGLSQIFEERIVVGAQAMASKVVQNPSGTVTLTIIEPDTSQAPGQIDEFIRSHGGAGVQHIAFGTDDLTAAVRDGTARGLQFLSTPAGYYDDLPARLGPVGVPVETLRELNILADRDHAGVMMQIFTASRHPRRTLFWELIERRGARTFGSNNIKALYEAVERERTADRAALS